MNRPQRYPFAAVSFKAWTVGTTGIAYPADLPGDIETPDQAATMAGAIHKDSVIVLHTNDALRFEKRHTVSIYTVKRSTKKGTWRAAYDGGRPVFVGNLEAHLVTRFNVAAGFSPIEPPDCIADPVGRDLTLVEGGQ